MSRAGRRAMASAGWGGAPPAPSSAKARAMARPMFDAPPVTITTRSPRPRSIAETYLRLEDGVRRCEHGSVAVQQRKSERTRQRILDSAAKVFREEGYANARLSDI